MKITKNDKEILRALAVRVKEAAENPENKEKADAWRRHNDLGSDARPIILCDPENGWNEIIPQASLESDGDLAREYEFILKKELFRAYSLKDDKVIDDCIYAADCAKVSGWGVESERIRSEATGSYAVEPGLKTYAGLEKLKFPQISFNHAKTQERLDLLKDVFYGIMDVKLKTYWWWSLGLTIVAAELRGLENLMLDMYDEPDNLHRLMSFLCDGTLNLLGQLKNCRKLYQNTGNTYIGSGGYGFTSELAFSDIVTTFDMWGFTESQETVSVSPQMFEEFIFPYQLKIAERFGLNCYGCCEPLEQRWDIVKRIPRLRRVSVSPWADTKKMAELLSNKYVYSLKPNPSYISQKEINETEVRAELKKKISHAYAGNCFLEIIMKDTHTLGNNPRNAIRWVEIAKEEAGVV